MLLEVLNDDSAMLFACHDAVADPQPCDNIEYIDNDPPSSINFYSFLMPNFLAVD